MKIKLKVARGGHIVGDYVEALASPDKLSAVFYDMHSVSHWVQNFDYEIIELKPEGVNTSVISLRQLLGQDVRSMEFK